jgi:hypothetical protein
MVSLALQRIASSWPWYGVRAFGLVSAALLVMVILMGIGQVTGFTYRYIEPIKAWAIHRALALSLAVSIALHVLMLLIDKQMRFSIPQILVPFVSTYNNGTKLLGLPFGVMAITFGILAMYGIYIIVFSSLGWIDTKKYLWQKLHYISYPVALFVVLHSLYAGTDLKHGWLRAVWIIMGIIVLFGFISRLRRSGSLKQDQ